MIFRLKGGTCSSRVSSQGDISHDRHCTYCDSFTKSRRRIRPDRTILYYIQLPRRGSSCFQLYSSFSCHVRGMRPRQSTRYFSKKISVARVTNRITTRESRQQWKRVGCLDEIEQIAAESAEQHDGNRTGERHRGNSRGQGVDPSVNGSNSAHDHRYHSSFSYQRRSRVRPTAKRSSLEAT